MAWLATLFPAAALALLLGAAAPARAGAPRVILAEDFTATWCPYCPHARCALEQLLGEYPDQLIVAELHWQDALATPWTEARKNEFYGLGGLPLVILDGTRFYLGASSCQGSVQTYRGGIEQRLQQSAVSPVRITGLHALDEEANTALLSATFLLEEPAPLGVTRAFLLLLENEVAVGGQLYQHVVRAAHEAPVVLAEPGDMVTIQVALPLDGVADAQALDGIAFLQRTDGDREVHQTARLLRASHAPPPADGPPAGREGIARVHPHPYAPAGGPLRVSLRLAEAGPPRAVALDLLDAEGRLVERLIRGPLAGGIQEHAWSGAPASLRSGAYFLRLTTPAGASVAPLLVVR
ncbi:MAG: hypothetical protein FJY75_09850 [Candidatus Eisenbacteria bacterium]|uniref:Omp28-related outer membrane protein n=1 Tax=Eiseniibacteriota bacterium TaxID=2212470 RepID=A0A938BRS9_UNCEI|nr:hypothetical protein [Candidatus Eisenbacteria bacterium]